MSNVDRLPDGEPIDLGDKDHVKVRNTEIKRRDIERGSTIAALLQHRHGREFIRWILDMCHVGTNGFDTNALRMAFLAGEQNIGMRILAELTTRENIDAYTAMLKGERDE